MENAKNATIVMGFNLGSDFDHCLYMVATVTDPKQFNSAHFIRFMKSANLYDTVSMDIVNSVGLQMGAPQTPLMGVPTNNPYAFGQFQIAQGVLLDDSYIPDWKKYYQQLNVVIRTYGDIENVIWFFQKDTLNSYLHSCQPAMFHQVILTNGDISSPSWYELQQVTSQGQSTTGAPHGQSNNMNGW